MLEIIAILRGVKPNEVLDIGEQLIKAGIKKIEVPLNSPEPYLSIESLIAEFGNVATIGAGTVLHSSEVEKLASIGVEMIVSPNCDVEVIQATKALGLQSYPGVFTPSECLNAVQAGADALKLFPASLMGIDGFNAIKVVLPSDTQFYPVGGVGPEDFSSWLDAGVTGFGLGSAIYKSGDSAEDVKLRAEKIVLAL